MMNRIIKIAKLRECATFRQYSWPNTLEDFSRYNLIYGWNGTGKTTLSNVFRCLEMKRRPDAIDAQVETSNQTIRVEDFQKHLTPMVRVFNRDFIKDHVFPDDGNLPPVFVLGETSIKTQEALNETKATIRKTATELQEAQSSLEKAEQDFDNFCSAQGRIIKNALQISGIDPYRNYNLNHFKNRAGDLNRPNPLAASKLSDSEKTAIIRIISQQPLDAISLIQPWSEVAKFHLNEVEQLLSESVVAQVLDELRDDIPLSAWIETGLKLHPENDRVLCKFCKQPLSSQRLVEIEGHFNYAAETLKGRIAEKVKVLETARTDLARKLPAKAEFYFQFQSEVAACILSFEKTYETRLKEYDALIGALKSKSTNLFASTEVQGSFDDLDNSSIDLMNTAIRRHNHETEQLNDTKRNACIEWEISSVFESLEEYNQKLLTVEQSRVKKQNLFQESSYLSKKATELETTLLQHRKPAEDLNADIKAYLGHNDLSLEVHETGYRIMRGAKVAVNLSEGERTAISILYFLKTLEDSSFDLSNSIVVLDDPVSSLDEKALFSAFSFIQSRTDSAGQVFILTHNFMFFRLVKRWFQSKQAKDSEKNRTEKSSFYMLQCNGGPGERHSELIKLDKLLLNYESDYQYIFSKVYEAAHQPSGVALESNYHLPNVARRLLESFLSFRFPHIKSNLLEHLKQTKVDAYKVQRIYRFCNAFSHNDHVPGAEHDSNILSETKEVMIEILNLIEQTDKVHFDNLVKLCRR